MGHEIGSHTERHPDLTTLTPAEMQDEIVGSKTVIDAQITSQKCVSFDYPSGTYNNSVVSIVQNRYIAARGVDCYLNSEPFQFYTLGGCEIGDGADGTYTLAQMETWADAAQQQKQWLVVIFHGVDGIGWEPLPIDTITAYLDYLKAKNLGVRTLGAMVKYIRERAAATLSVVSSSSDQIVLSLTDTVDDTIYSEPLTIRSEVPSSWALVDVQQGSSIITVASAVEGTTTAIYYNAIPDRGLITVRSSPPAIPIRVGV